MQLKTQNLDSSCRTLKFAKYIMKKPHCVALRVLSCSDSHSHIQGKWNILCFLKLKRCKRTVPFTRVKDGSLVPSECWQRYCFLLKSRVTLRLWSLFKTWVFWKDTWWCCSYWDQQYDLIILSGFFKFWPYTDLGHWFQKEKDGVVVI